MRNRYDASILQSKTAANKIILIKDMDAVLFKLQKLLKSKDEYELYNLQSLHLEVKSLKRLHKKSLNSLRGFKQKTHSEQLKYINSEAHSERYKPPLK